jgi:hypothetical protein
LHLPAVDDPPLFSLEGGPEKRRKKEEREKKT